MRKIYLFLLALCVSSVTATVKAQTYPPTNQDTYGYNVLSSILSAKLTTTVASNNAHKRFCKAIPMTPKYGETQYGSKQTLPFNVGITMDNRGEYPSYNNLSVLKAQGFVTADEFTFKVGQTLSPKPEKAVDVYGFDDAAWDGSWMPYAVYIDYSIDEVFSADELVSSQSASSGSAAYCNAVSFRASTVPGTYRIRLMTGATTPPEGTASMATTGGNMIADAYITLVRPTVTFSYEASRGTVTGGTAADELVCGVDYAFTVTPNSGYDVEEVSVVVGDETVSQTYTLTAESDGSYKVPASQFQNDMKITVNFVKHTFTAADAAAGNCYFRLKNKFYTLSSSYSSVSDKTIRDYLKVGIAHQTAGEGETTSDRIVEGAPTLYIQELDNSSASYIWKLEKISETSTYYLTCQGYKMGAITNGEQKAVMMAATPGAEEAKPVTVGQVGEYYTFTTGSGSKGYMHGLIHGQTMPGNTDAYCPTTEGNYVASWSTDADASQWTIEPIEEFNITIGKGGWSTIHYAFPVSLPASVVKAYVVSGETESAVSLTEVEPEGDAILLPSNTPVFLQGTEDDACTVSILLSEPDAVGDNKLRGTLVAESPTGNIYGIATPSGKPTALYKMTAGTTIPCNKAYLESSQSSVAKLDLNFGGEPTGIESLTPDPTTVDSNVLYDLNGRRVLYPTRGIYVTGSGKKIYLK